MMRRLVKFSPKLVIFDVDGVLVDVHGSFHKSIIDTVKHFTGKRVTHARYSEVEEQVRLQRRLAA